MLKRATIILFTAILICLALTACSGQSVDLYFTVESEGSFYLQAQTRQVKSSPNIYQASLEQLIAGPGQSNLLPTIPASTKVNHVKVDNGLAIADFSAHILTDTSIPHSSTTEKLAIYSIVNTLTQFEGIEKVRITVENKSSGTIDGRSIEDFWGHIGLYDDFSKNEEIILKNEN